MNKESILQGDFAKGPGLDGSLVILIIPILCKDVQGIFGFIDSTIEDDASVSVLSAGEHLALDQIV